ncbi:UDP-GlcNAc:betaGal beta-1,3-N-acetylglucosaminyltransferase-like protein 1 isoform X2 [Hemibagrus wyckioides]|uniref:UDP-GlcNAc:betaGal beta-1,3-N-acetylglucosaminyltransferase-like protein 1 isoform X2 n=1 Tax=Hemibagrus wyckioides TaxID=337641 RepID=UPI00266D17E2|nr:UDP-GlcNAc:betaGal beta-1,3-N-acetylglucosaminyltransferase-like protein 1 isoform X2 [Hemibagrus wyckioides]
MSSPQRCPGELEEECNEAKRVCFSLQHEDITVEPQAVTLECRPVIMESRDDSNEVKHNAVGASAATLGSIGVTKKALVDNVEFKGTTMESAAVFDTLEENSATMESSVDKLQSTDETLGWNMVLQLNTDSVALGSNTTLQSNSATLRNDNAPLESNDATLGSNGVALGPNTTLQSNCTNLGYDNAPLESNDATLGSSTVALGSYTTLQSNCTTLRNDNVPLESNDATLGTNSVALRFNNATVESGSAAVNSTGACETVEGSNIQVSVIIPVYNAANWLDECLQAVSDQDFQGTLEISVFDDGSMDNSREIAESWRERLRMRGVTMAISGHNTDRPRGVGFAKNKAVAQSSGQYLCFQDADDVMMPQRVRLQYEAAVLNPNTIVGCQVRRVPEGSTERYTRWINTLTPEQLLTQVYTSHGPTVVMPTWFCSRCWFQKVGPFDEGGKGVPEDLLWFYQSLRRGGGVIRVDECLLIYRYHEQAATHSVLEETIWSLRVDFLQERVLRQWGSFTIWNAGKQGRKLYRSLTSTNQKKVKAFCDVDENKIKKGFYTYEESKERPKPRIPVLHYRDSSPPFIVCVKLDMTGGVLEEILLSLSLTEGVDYYHFN